MEGQTATNPQTGEKVVLQGGQWVPVGRAPQPAPQSRAPGFIPGTPKAPNPYDVQQDDIANQRAAEDQRLRQEAAVREAAKFATEQAERDEKLRVTTGAKDKTAASLRDNLARIDRIIKDADDNGGWGETGTSGAIMRAIGPSGTAGYSLASELETLKGNNAFTALIGLAEQGIKLTPISNAEVKLAADSIANLDPNADHETFMRTLRSLRDKYSETLAGLEGPSVSTPEAAAQMTQGMAGAFTPQGTPPAPQGGGVPGATMDNITFDMDTGSGAFGSQIEGPRMTAPQEAAYKSFIQANKGNPNFGPEQVNAFYQSIGLQGADLTGSDAFFEAVRKGESVGDVNYALTDEAAKKAAMDASLREAPEGTDLSTVGLQKGLMLNMTDELRGGIGGVGSLLSGEGFMSGYQSERDIERALQERSREQNGLVPELAGSLLTPVGVFGTAKTARQFANQGAALGGTSGFGEGQGASNSLAGAGVGAGLGAALGGTISQAPRAVNALMQTGPGQKVAGAFRRNPGEVNREVIEAGQRQNIPIRQPDARPETRNAFAVVEASPSQGPKIKTTLDADKAAVQSRLDAVSGDGTRLDNFSMGESIQGAGQRAIVKTRAQANAMYGRATQLAGDTKVKPDQALKAIDDNIAELTQAGPKGNAGAIKYLKDLRSDLARGELSIDQLRSIRTNMRGQISERNLTATDAERRVGDVLRAASADIERGLSSNPQALGAYKSADKFYQEKQTFIKDVVQKFTGSRNNPLSAEQAATKFKAMMQNKGDYKRFSEMMKRLDPEERSDIAASIGESMGTSARNGEFTLAALATNVEKLNPRALRDLFGEEGAKAIADLRIIARAKADTAGGLNNSKSGVVSAGTNQFKDILLGLVGGSAAGIPGAMAGMAARGGIERLTSARAARLLLNPDFTKWLRQTPNSTSPAVINRHFDRLNKIASREQVFLMDAKALQDYLRGSVSEGIGRAAATGDERQDNGRK